MKLLQAPWRVTAVGLWLVVDLRAGVERSMWRAWSGGLRGDLGVEEFVVVEFVLESFGTS